MTNKKTNFTIDSIVNLLQLNKLTGEVSNKSFIECRGNNLIRCNMSCTLPSNMHIIKVKLRVPKLSSTKTSFYLCDIGNNNVILDPGFTVEAGIISEDENDNYQYIDISTYVLNKTSEIISFVIKPTDSNSYFTCNNYPEIVVDGISKEYYVPDKSTIKKEIGDYNSCFIDPFDRTFTTVTNLLSLEGGDLPLNLRLVYNHHNGTKSISNYYKLNYDQFVYLDGSNYKYEDGKCVIHTFMPTNIHNIYHDVTQPGLVLTIENGCYYITDDKLTKLSFNSSGRLISIAYKRTDTYTAYLNIRYENDRITTIYDDYGRFCEIAYNENNITITKPDLSVIVCEYTESEITRITGITNNSDENNSISFMYVYEDERVILKSITDINGHTIVFDYMNDGLLTGIIEYVRVGLVNSFVSKNLFSSFDKRARIENYKTQNVMNSVSYIEYDDEGSVIKTYNKINNVTTNVKNIYKTTYAHYRDTEKFSEEYKILVPEAYKNYSAFKTLTTKAYAEEVCNNNYVDINTLNDDPFQVYSFETRFLYKLSESINVYKTPHFYIMINVYADGVNSTQFIGGLNIKESDDEYENIVEKHISSYFKLPRSANTRVFFYLRVQGCNIELFLEDVVIKKGATYGEHYGVFDKTNGLTSPYINDDWINIDEIEEFTVNNETIKMKDEEDNYNIINSVTKLDYLLTINRMRSIDFNGYYYIYYNNGKNMIVSTEKPTYTYIRQNLNEVNIELDNILFGIINGSEYMNSIEFSKYQNNLIEVITNTKYSNEENAQYLTTKETINKYGRVLKIEDFSGIVQQNAYNISDTTESVITNIIPPVNSLNILPQTICSTSIQNKDISGIEYIESQYLYPEGYNEQQITSKTFRRRLAGVIMKDTLSNNQEINYGYKQDNTSLESISAIVNNVENKNIISYSTNKISKLNHNNTNITFTYGAKNELETVKINNSNIISNVYSYSSHHTTITTTYNTGESLTKKYDLHGRLIEIKDNGGNVIYSNLYQKRYDENQEYIEVDTTNFPDALLRINRDGDNYTNFYYDKTDYNEDNPDIDVSENGYKQVTRIENSNYLKTIGYDKLRRLKKLRLRNFFLDQTLLFYYINGDKYNKEKLDKINISFNNVNLEKSYTYDPLNRIIKINYKNNNLTISKNYTYFTGNSYTSNVIKTITTQIGDNFLSIETLKYDSLGNITEIIYNSNTKIKYTYDSIGRLIREDNDCLGRIYIYTYDNNGNITTKKEFAYPDANYEEEAMIETIYSYDEVYQDKLVGLRVGFDNYTLTYGTDTCTILPLTYKGAILTWSLNNRLSSYKKNENSAPVIYEYNALGQRIKKIYTNSDNQRVQEEYIYTDDLLTNIIILLLDENDEIISTNYNNRIDFIYDENTMIGFIHNENVYYYVRDVLGNIKFILDSSYNIVCKYEYDAWGNHKVYQYTNGVYTVNNQISFIGNINPIRYKGYYYDVETKLFYCNSRYYSPELCRFISPDDVEYLDPESVNGLNLYCYCMNNPIMYVDPSGHSVIVAMLIGAGIGLVAGLASQVVSDVFSNIWEYGFDFSEWQMSSWQSYVGAGLGGAIGGMFTPLFGAVAVGFITGTASTALTMGLSNATGATNYGFGEIVASSLSIGMVSGLTAGIVDNIKIPKFNAGRNSWNAISKQINTKLIKGTINSVSEKTLGKMFALSFLYSVPFTAFNSAFTILNMKG